MKENELPFGTQFSPNIIDLQDVLRFTDENKGKTIQDFVRLLAERYFAASSTPEKMAGNMKISMTSYGIVTDGEVGFTDLGRELLAIQDEEELHAAFAKRILLHMNGLKLIETLHQLDLHGETATNTSVNNALIAQGFLLRQTSNNAQVMKLWLEKANILNGWRINEGKLSELIGIESGDIGPLRELPPEQYYFLLALCNASSDKPLVATDVRNLATATFNFEFEEKTFANRVIKPLQAKELISAEKTTEGRGAKPYIVSLTDKTKKEVIEPLLEQFKDQVGSPLVEAYCKSFAVLREEIDSEDRYKKGLALEAFAIKVMRIIGLDFVKTRYRDIQIGGAEVDVIFDSSHLVYNRWQVQCKNTANVTIDMVAKEVGLSYLLKSNAIVMMTTGHLTPDAKKYARRIMKDMNLCVLTLEKEDIDDIIEKPTNIVSILNAQAENAKRIKLL
ncbi:MAG: restriction endonuclease [Lachnospiraceae bacterium]|nr:restriction endonuclease [Lachnospiraceae bacterium]